MKTTKQHLKRSIHFFFYCIAMLFIFSLNNAKAITISTPGASSLPNPSTCAVNGQIGVFFSATLTTSGGTGTDWTEEGFSGAANLSAIGLSLNSATGEISGTPTESGEFILYVSVADASDNSQVDAKYIKICIERLPVDIVLVLDRSGSMSLTACSDASDPDCALSRYQYMKNATGLLMAEYNSLKVTGDRVGAVAFTNTTTTWPSSLANVGPSTESQINTFITNNPPSLTTAMGQGILDGLSTFDANSDSIIILLTDGIQNVSPMVTTAAPNTEVSGTVLANTNTKIYCFGINAPASVYTVLQDISSSTGGNSYFNTNIAGTVHFDLNSDFDQILDNILANSSPQQIDYRFASFPVINKVPPMTHVQLLLSKDEQTFIINKNLPLVIFKAISSNLSEGIRDLRILKDGIDVTNNNESFVHSEYFKLISFRLPFIDTLGNEVKSSGEWKMIITGISGKKYEASATVDDHHLDIVPNVEVNNFEVGEPMQISIDINYNKLPVTDSVKVQAIVLKPGDDLGTLLAEADVDPGVSPEGVGNVAGDKYQALLDDSSLFGSLIPTDRIIELNHMSNGTYSATFTETEESGPYRVIYKISGKKSVFGRIERTVTRCVMLNFGKADISTEEEIKLIVDAGSKNPVQLYLKPKNKFGYLLGPGYASMINVTGPDGKLTQVTDLGNGTYLYNVPGATPDQKQVIKVSFRDNKIFDGKVDKNGPVTPHTMWFYILIAIILIILILRNMVSKGTIKKIPNWLLILLILILIVLLYLNRQGIISF